MKRKIMVFLLTGLFLLSGLSQAFAYTLVGPKWQNPQAPTYQFSSNVPQDIKDASNNAAGYWRTDTNYKVHLGYSSSGAIFITTYNDSKSNYSGLTTLKTNWSGDYITGANVSINLYYTNSYNAQGKESVMGHEFGHTLGLGESSDLWALMYPSDSERNYRGTYRPRPDDVAGINALYP